MLGAELTGNEAGKVTDLRRNLTERTDDKAENAPRVVSVNLCLDGLVAPAGVPSFAPNFLAALWESPL